MDLVKLRSVLKIGENVAVEFKRCGNGIESDTYETVCSFLNRFGGDIFLGVLDDGTVSGVPDKAAADMIKNFIKVVSNPEIFSPTVYLDPEIIKYDENHIIIHIHVPPSAEVHSYKKTIYDREIIKTNLIESYDKLMEFGKKHLPDKFFLEDTTNKSLRNIILREMVSNVLMHREFTSSYTAKFVIEHDRMYVENANRAAYQGFVTVDNLEPNPKNPIIAAFFRNIGYADQLGSGVRNLFKYSKYYSGKEPQFEEGDVFKIVMPLDESYSFDYAVNFDVNKSADKMPIKCRQMPVNAGKVPMHMEINYVSQSLSEQYKRLVLYVEKNGKITSREAEKLLEVKQRRARKILSEMADAGLLEKRGNYKTTVYVKKQ